MVTTGQGQVERRLVAILAADVAGYSRLTGLDEEGTHAQLQDHLHSLVDPKIAQHRLSRTPATAGLPSSAAWWMRCDALSRSSGEWPSVTPIFQKTTGLS